MNLRLGSIKVPRRFVVIGKVVYELEEFRRDYSPIDGRHDSLVSLTAVGDLITYRNIWATVTSARVGDAVIVTDGMKMEIHTVREVADCYDIYVDGKEELVKYGTYTVIVDVRGVDEDCRALKYLYEDNEAVATSLTYKIHEELRSDETDYEKVSEMMQLVKEYRNKGDVNID